MLPVFTTKSIVMPVANPIRFFLDEEYEARLRCHLLFDRMLSHAELVALCGGGDGEKTEMTIGIIKTGLYLEYQHFPSDCVGSCMIHRRDDRRLVLVNEHVRFLRRNGIERKKFHWFSRQKFACESLGVSAIDVTGARSSITQGFYYYPLFGFNAPLPPGFYRFLTQELSHCQTLLDLYEQPQGRKAWAMNGCPCEMSFELDGRFNPSQLAYDQYAKQY